MSRQMVAPSVAVVCPLGHWEHDDEPDEGEKDPTGQLLHGATPPLPLVPAAQMAAHDDDEVAPVPTVDSPDWQLTQPSAPELS
mmetsp:Transcript_51952/g.112883  ORF Transcript_51952/g.112883 Transcript_51952/m.112883 type:complete len:83 (+) Transcript_51952:1528-1776(+)